MNIRCIMKHYSVLVGVIIGLAVIVLVIGAVVYIPGEAEIALLISAIGCVMVPLVLMIADYFKGMKSQRGQRISNKRSLAN